jgi:hypothetical protein
VPDESLSDQDRSPAEKFTVTAPSITLPKGGGAISGIGEKFAANPVTGTGSMTVPVFTSPGRGGFRLQHCLSYDTGAGNGPFGFGWTLSAPWIMRRTDRRLPKYQDWDESDIFILSGADDLVPVLVKGDDGRQRQPFDSPASRPGFVVQHYRPRIEGLFVRDGPSRRPASRTGAPSPRTMLPRSMARATTPGSPIPPIRDASSNGSSARATTT